MKMTRNSDVKTKNVKLPPAASVAKNPTSHYHATVSPISPVFPLIGTAEHKKDKKESAKHLVEEAMSAALIQTCNKCKKPFIKDYGCNKMSCSCGNLQCYVCGQSIHDYAHFDRSRPDGTKCPLHDNARRLESKIRKAQEEAVKKVLEETDGVAEEDLKVDTGNVKPNKNPNRQDFHYYGPLGHHGALPPPPHVVRNVDDMPGFGRLPGFDNLPNPGFPVREPFASLLILSRFAFFMQT
jgi:hypothetical protein